MVVIFASIREEDISAKTVEVWVYMSMVITNLLALHVKTQKKTLNDDLIIIINYRNIEL